MKGITKRRLEFGIDQALTIAITVASIWYASRIGYREAIRFSRYEDVRETRAWMNAIDRELASNEEALRRALEEGSVAGRRNVHVAVRAFERGKDSEQFFALDRRTLGALQQAYADRAGQAQESGAGLRSQALVLMWRLEKCEQARPLLAEDLRRLSDQLRRDGPDDPLPGAQLRSAGLRESTPDERAVTGRAASSGFVRPAAGRYDGPLKPFGWTHLAVPAVTGGPVLIDYSVRLPADRTSARLWLIFRATCPLDWDQELLPGQDDQALRRLFSGEGDGFVLQCPLDTANADRPDAGSVSVAGQILDPNRPAGWRWLYVLVEDDRGTRHPADFLVTWQVGMENPDRLCRQPSPDALVIPRGYLR